jgi:hypothetical protein
VVRETVDFHQRIVLTDRELDGALDRLQGAGLVVPAHGGYAAAPPVVGVLPQTKSDAVSIAAAPWQRLWARLAAAVPHDT